ncbi:hypothetical protein EVAR_19928_1 [Eumeta japonica]|uniref:Uncharacterized protein n=1 Tax=Eumeta variegata TaxID=151549 RepID=A0A4C1ZK38_EUMVA|nr:hypothetical protein EVAR_19928_1 [Eumeta japonica]
MPYGRLLRVSLRHRMSPETVTGRFPFSCPTGSGLRRPGGVRELRLSTAAVRASGGSISTFRGLRSGRRRLIVNRRSKGALECDPAMSKNRFDASFMWRNMERLVLLLKERKRAWYHQRESELDAGRRARYVVGVRGVQEGREGGALRNSGSD